MDNSQKRSEIISKIRKLSAITNPDANAFQGEMENAAKLISKLMDEYTVTWSEVHAAEASAQQAELKDEFISMQAENYIRGVMQWHWELAHCIARVTHTRDYGRTNRGKSGHMVFFGATENVTIATALFAEWTQIIERMAVNAYSSRFKALRNKYGRGDGLMDRVPPEEKLTYFKGSFIQGVVDGIKSVIDRAERERSSETTTALMVVSTQLNKRYAELASTFVHVKTKGVKNFSIKAYQAGKSVGSNIDITLKRVNPKNGDRGNNGPKLLN